MHISWKFSPNIYYTQVCTIHDTFVNFLGRNSNKCIFYGFNKRHTFTKQKHTGILHNRTCHQEKGSIEIAVIDISKRNSDAYYKRNVVKIVNADYYSKTCVGV